MAKSERSKKSKVLTSVAAVVLAVSMIIGGGTYAYLEAESDDVVNKFNTEQVTVALDETGDKEYDIIPGTSEDKDPKVTVTNSVDAYVYVTVEDTTQGLVDYEIADGWLPLDGYENVYYREVAAGEEPQEFYVLKDNKVSYDAALTNANMEGKEDLKLTFKAYAIQKAPFNEPVAAWEGKDSVVKTEEELTQAITNGKPVTLSTDMSVDVSTINNVGNSQINLNGKTLTIDGSTYMQVANGETISFANGTVNFDNTNPNYISVNVGEGSTVNFDNTEVDMKGKSILVNYGINTATVNVEDSTIYTSDYYCISTNASDLTSGKNVVINVINSSLTADDPNGDCTAILMNVPGTLTIDNSTITAGRQAVIVRTGTATIKDSTLINTLEYTSANWAKYDNTGWGSGNEVPVAVLVAGDRATAYPWNTEVTLDNVTLQYNGETDRAPIYAAAYGGYTTVINGAGDYEVTISSDADGVTVNK